MATQDLLDRLTRHQIFIQRLAGGEVYRLQQGLENIKYRMENYLLGRNSSILDDKMSARLQLQMTDIDQYLRATWADVPTQYKQFGIDFMEYEAKFSADAIGKTTSVPFLPPSIEQIRSSYETKILNLVPNKITGRTVEGYLEHFGNDKRTQMLQTIRDGYLFGWTNREAIKQVNQVVDLQKSQTATWVRTLTNHLAVQARTMTLEENDDILDGYEWVATLDSRTSLICMGRDGIIYPNTNDPEKSPKPPAHFGCRSTIVPAVNPEFDLLADEPETRFARGQDGKRTLVDGKLNYEQWLRKQPKSFQIKVLGRERQKLFEQKKLPLSRFVDPSGRTLTLEELKRLDVEFNGMTINEVVAATAPEPQLEPEIGYRYRSINEIEFRSPEAARERLAQYVAGGAADNRNHPNKRYGGRPRSDWGKVDDFNDDVAVGLDACMDDLESLARLFNIPNLRGLYLTPRKVNASMGDGTMYVSEKYLGKRIEGGAANRNAMKIREGKQVPSRSNWNQGDDPEMKPWSVASYQDTNFDTFRSTIIHEFGHHVHQQYKFSPEEFLNEYGRALQQNTTGGWQKFSPIEKRLYKLWGTRAKGIKKDGKVTAPSQYAETNPVEWFADNFSAYFLNRRDKCDPKFIQLIEEMIENAYR